MPILPYINLPQNNVPDLLGSIGDTLVSAAQRKKQKEKDAADLLLRQRTADREDQMTQAQLGNYASEAEARKSEIEMRRAQEKRIGAQETRQTGLDVATALPQIRAMLIPGSPTYDPQTAMSLARAHGINLTATQPTPPTEPNIQQPKPSLPAGIDAVSGGGPSIDPEATKQADLQRQQYGDQVAKFRTAQPTYAGTSPIGPVNIDPNAALEAQRFSLAENQRKMGPLMNIPGMEKYAPGIQAAIASGAKPEQVNALVSKAIEDSRKDQEKADYELTAKQKYEHNQAMERAAMANAGARQGQAAGLEASRNDMTTNRNLNTYMGTMKEFENNAGVKPDVAMMKNIGKIHEELTASPASPVAQAAAIDTISQIAQGGKASQGVMNQINAHALGPLESAYDKAYQVAHNGAHSPAWVSSMSRTLDGLKKYAGEEQTRVMSGFEAAAGDQSPFQGPEYSQLRDSQRRKLSASMGLDVPPPRPVEAGAMAPGTGKRPRADNPLTRAAKGRPQQAPINDLLKQAGF